MSFTEVATSHPGFLLDQYRVVRGNAKRRILNLTNRNNKNTGAELHNGTVILVLDYNFVATLFFLILPIILITTNSVRNHDGS